MPTDDGQQLTGPLWETIRSAGIVITETDAGWEYVVADGLLDGGGQSTALEALGEALRILIGIAKNS